jgi:hypothetical protein
MLRAFIDWLADPWETDAFNRMHRRAQKAEGEVVRLRAENERLRGVIQQTLDLACYGGGERVVMAPSDVMALRGIALDHLARAAGSPSGGSDNEGGAPT